MYSLILSDDVVAAIDGLAYSYKTSRSNLINRILAGHLSLLTPERRIADIFSNAAQVAGNQSTLQIQPTPSGTTLEIRSVLKYKYNPSIRYNVEIRTDDSGYFGEFRMVSRSQSGALLAELNAFLDMWCSIEQSCLDCQPQHEVRDGRYRRPLTVETGGEIHDSETLGNTIGSYIRLFDNALSLFFSAPNEEVSDTVYSLYQQYLKDSDIVL